MRLGHGPLPQESPWHCENVAEITRRLVALPQEIRAQEMVVQKHREGVRGIDPIKETEKFNFRQDARSHEEANLRMLENELRVYIAIAGMIEREKRELTL